MRRLIHVLALARRRYHAFAGAALLLTLAGARADEAAVKSPVPDVAARKGAQKLVDSTYGQQLRAAKTRESKIALSRTVLAGAREEHDLTARFVVLNLSKDQAAEAADIDDAFAAIAELDAAYEIDRVHLKTEAIKVAAKGASTAATRKMVARAADATIDDAAMSEQFQAARTVGELGITLARKDNDTAAATAFAKKVIDVSAAEQAFTAQKSALDVLKSKPEDPVANASVGRYRCFFKSDWETGLPMLASGNDIDLQSLAKQEIAGVTTPDQQVSMADAWFDYAKKQTGRAKVGLLEHAQKWYVTASDQLAGLPKLKVEKRISEIAAMVPHRVIDLLKIVDPARDARESVWHLTGGELSDDGSARAEIRFPYRPPAECDYTIEYTRE